MKKLIILLIFILILSCSNRTVKLNLLEVSEHCSIYLEAERRVFDLSNMKMAELKVLKHQLDLADIHLAYDPENSEKLILHEKLSREYDKFYIETIEYQESIREQILGPIIQRVEIYISEYAEESRYTVDFVDVEDTGRNETKEIVEYINSKTSSLYQ